MQALILAGGTGTRFWPLSRRRRPKQLLALDGERSLLQQTVDRLAGLVGPEGVWVCTTEALAGPVREQLPEVPAAQVLAEPTGRNTAPAIAWAVASMPAAVREEPVVVLPADHRVEDARGLRRALAAAAAEAAERDRVFALGVTPRWAETGYGYLELADAPRGGEPVRVERFTEKPDRAAAERFLATGRYLWNAGIFVFQGSTLLRLVNRCLPDLAAGLAELAEAPDRLSEIYARLPSISIDYAVMERLDELWTLPLDVGWSDLGSWQALAEVSPADVAGNVTRGDVLALDSAGNLLVADQGTVAVLGVSGLVVVRTGDTVLVLPRERSQEVRRIVDALAADERDDLL